MLWPTCATSPLTLTRPSAMRCSSARREPSPACASTLCRRSSSRGAAASVVARLSVSLRAGFCLSSIILLLRRGRGGVVIVGFLHLRVGGGGVVGGRDLRVERQLRVQFAEVLQFRQRRQFVQALEPEVIEEALGGGQIGRASCRERVLRYV